MFPWALWALDDRNFNRVETLCGFRLLCLCLSRVSQ